MPNAEVPQNADAVVEDVQESTTPDQYAGLAEEIAQIEAANQDAPDDSEFAPVTDDGTPEVPAAKGGGDLDSIVEAKINERAARQEEIQASKRAAKEASDKILGEAETRAKEMIAAAQKQAEDFIANLRKNPVDAIKQAGWDPMGLMKNLAEDGTPHSTMQRELMEAKARAERVERQFTEFVESQKKAQEAAAFAAQQQSHQQAAEKFSEHVLTDARPALTALFKEAPPELREVFIRQADAEVERVKQQTGAYPTWDQVADTLEQRYSKGKTAAQPKAEAPKNSGKPPSRAVSQAVASEKRSSQKSWDEMDERERTRTMVQEAEAILKAAMAAEVSEQ